MSTTIKKTKQPASPSLLINERAISDITAFVKNKERQLNRASKVFLENNIPIESVDAFATIITEAKQSGWSAKEMLWLNDPQNKKLRAVYAYEIIAKRAHYFAAKNSLEGNIVISMRWENIVWPRGGSPRLTLKNKQFVELRADSFSIFPGYPHYSDDQHRPLGELFPNLNSIDFDPYYFQRIAADVALRYDSEEALNLILRDNMLVSFLKYFIVDLDGSIVAHPNLREILIAEYSREPTDREINEIKAKEEAVEVINAVRDSYDPDFMRPIAKLYDGNSNQEVALFKKKASLSSYTTIQKILNRKS